MELPTRILLIALGLGFGALLLVHLLLRFH